MTRTEIRWVLLPFEVVLAFVVVGIVSALIAESLYLWYEPFAGFFAAFAVVSASYLGAPRWKLPVALASFILGGAAAYQLLKDTFYPENYTSPYEPTLMPFWVTLGGGVFALVVVSIHALAKRRSPSNTSLERTREG